MCGPFFISGRMKIRLGLKRYEIRPYHISTLVEVERLTDKPYYDLEDTPDDMLDYYFAMFRAAGLWLPKVLFLMLITSEQVQQITDFMEEEASKEQPEPDPEPDTMQPEPEKISAHNLLMQLVIISGLTAKQVLQLSDMERNALTEAHSMLNRDKWEQARFIAFNATRKDLKNPDCTLDEFWPFSWEVEAKKRIKPMSEETFRKIMARK